MNCKVLLCQFTLMNLVLTAIVSSIESGSGQKPPFFLAADPGQRLGFSCRLPLKSDGMVCFFVASRKQPGTDFYHAGQPGESRAVSPAPATPAVSQARLCERQPLSFVVLARNEPDDLPHDYLLNSLTIRQGEAVTTLLLGKMSNAEDTQIEGGL